MRKAIRLLSRSKSLLRDCSGVAVVEFALATPLLVGVIAYGIEVANMAYSAQMISDIAIQTADSAARLRTTISEQDVTDIMNGVKRMGSRIHFAQHGRIIVSGLAPVVDGSNTVTNQTITWQRCSGALHENSSYGTQGQSVGLTGMGPANNKITVTAGTYAVVVEIRYDYQPIISQALLGPRKQVALSAMMVRERETNTLASTGTASSCSTYSA